MKYYRASKGYFYKISEKGIKTRISKDAYLKLIKKNVIVKKNLSPKHSSKPYSSAEEQKCREYLYQKMQENIAEFELGRYSSKSQAFAVSYAQTKKKYPNCAKYFKK